MHTLFGITLVLYLKYARVVTRYQFSLAMLQTMVSNFNDKIDPTRI